MLTTLSATGRDRAQCDRLWSWDHWSRWQSLSLDTQRATTTSIPTSGEMYIPWATFRQDLASPAWAGEPGSRPQMGQLNSPSHLEISHCAEDHFWPSEGQEEAQRECLLAQTGRRKCLHFFFFFLLPTLRWWNWMQINWNKGAVSHLQVITQAGPSPRKLPSPEVTPLPSHSLLLLETGSVCLHLAGGKEHACQAGDVGSITGSGRSPGEGNGNLLQYSCLENPMDWGAWRATVHGVPESQTSLSDWTTLSSPAEQSKALQMSSEWTRP